MSELLRAAGVIARRDFTALVGSKAFILFLLAPLLLVAVIVGATWLDDRSNEPEGAPRIGLLLPAADAHRIAGGHDEARRRYGFDDLPELEVGRCGARGPASCLRLKGYQAILSGSIAHPVLTAGGDNVERWGGRIALLVDLARQPASASGASLSVHRVAIPPAKADASAMAGTAEVAQIAIFTLSIMLSGMMLSNLVEEKSGKILEILAASVPVDAIFLGKLVAMLGVALLAALLWVGMGAAFELLLHLPLPPLAAPAIGWPAFMLLAALYFLMTYGLLGSLMLGVGSLAGTAREAQMLSLPLTFAQLFLFMLAHSTVHALGHPSELAAAIFPFSSPFAMVARAAEQEVLWPHLLALPWQAIWLAITVRVTASLFRRNVMQARGPWRIRFWRHHGG